MALTITINNHTLSNNLLWVMDYFPRIVGMDFTKAHETIPEQGILLYMYAAMRFAGDPSLSMRDPKTYSPIVIGEIDIEDLMNEKSEFNVGMAKLLDEYQKKIQKAAAN